ncbi:hypothetical protein V5H01_17555 [Vibrio cholerae]
MFNLHKLAFAFFLDADLVERVESSVVSKSLNHRCDLAFFVTDT